jgi:Tol biopolymer transport system component
MPTLTGVVDVDPASTSTAAQTQSVTATQQFCPAHQMLVSGDGHLYVICFDDTQTYFEYEFLKIGEGGIFAPNGAFIMLIDPDEANLYNFEGELAYTIDGIHQLEDMYWATWSPDKDFMAYSAVSRTESSKILIRVRFMHLPSQAISDTYISSETLGDSDQAYPMLTDRENFIYPTWAPDGKYLAIYDQDLNTVHLVEAACTPDTNECTTAHDSVRTLPPEVKVFTPVAWNPDGSMMAAICKNDEKPGICIFDIDGNIVRKSDSVDFELGWAEHVTWSHEGDLIAFQATTMDTFQQVIYVLNASDMSIYAILSSEAKDYQSPMWMP